MDAENQLFFRRIGQLPVVKAVSEQAISAYEVAKNSNRLFNATFQLAENSVKYASEVEPVKKILDSQLVAVANKVAVNQWDKIEHQFPVVHKTPDELWTVGKNIYDRSLLKNNVDKLYNAKTYGVTKISNTKKYYQDLVSGKLDTLLDYSDSMVDKYVATAHEANGQPPQCAATDSYFNRVHCISGKAYHGLKDRAGEKLDATKQYALQTLGDLQTAMFLLEYAKNTAAWANVKTQETLSTAQEQAKALWHEIQRRAEPISGRSEAIVLNLVQSLAATMASLSQQVAKYSTPYLPEGVEKTVMAGASYAAELRDTFGKAKTLGDLRDEVIAEAKQKLGYVQDGLTKGIDYLVEFPPVCWLAHPARNPVPVIDGVVSEKTENGFVGGEHEKNGGH